MEQREDEIWKPIPGYEGLYEVSSWGNIKSLENKRKSSYGSFSINKEKQIKIFVTRKYYSCILTKNSIRKTIRVHRIVFKVFNDNTDRIISDLKDINHKDLDRLNNYYKNLEEVSKSENQTHRYMNTDKSSIFPGVTYKKDGNRKKRWYVSFSLNKKRIYVGTFFTEYEGYRAYLKALNEYGLENKYATESQ